MSSDQQRIDEIFDSAAKKSDPDERKKYLLAACGTDVELRERIERLLNTWGNAAVENPTPEIEQTKAYSLLEKQKDHVGPYKILQKIGEGGFGVVYMAEQNEPVERRVALKIIKPGMDSRQVIARFEAERQALAMMDHPNIAKVFHAGTTEDGRPFFVMELVRGIPITSYCDEYKLTITKRLELFIQVCQGVQHAHHKGVIHRDLKPSNILVAEYNDRAVAKVIDFGVAKAVENKLTEKTLCTQYGQIVGTFEYMSPEQARMNQLDIDTRTDIYSLGVLLYELLTGVTPMERQRMQSLALDEMLKAKREHEPQKPSQRLSSLDSLQKVAESRRIEPQKLGKTLRGDLDWIVVKALAKEPSRRYETPTGLANDVRRHLDNEPIMASPPSATYRLQKFLQRNRAIVFTGCVVAGLLIVSSVVSTLFAIWATDAEQRALIGEQKAQRARDSEIRQREAAQKTADIAKMESTKANEVTDLLREMLRSVGPSVALGRDVTILKEIVDVAARDIESRLKTQPEVAAELYNTLGDVYGGLAEPESSEKMIRKVYELMVSIHGEEHEETIDALIHLAWATYRNRDSLQAETYARTALSSLKNIVPREQIVARAHSVLGTALSGQGRFRESIESYEKSLEIYKKDNGEDTPEVCALYNNIALVYRDLGEIERAIELFKNAIRLNQTHRSAALYHKNLGDTLAAIGRTAEAEESLRKSLITTREVLGDNHSYTVSRAQTYTQLAMNLAFEFLWDGRSSEHDQLKLRLLDLAKDVEDPAAADRAAKAILFSPKNDPKILEQAAALARRAIELEKVSILRKKTTRKNEWFPLGLGIAFHREGDFEKAEKSLKKARSSQHFPLRVTAKIFSAMNYWKLGKKEVATDFLNESREDLGYLTMLRFDSAARAISQGLDVSELPLLIAYREAQELFGIEDPSTLSIEERVEMVLDMKQESVRRQPNDTENAMHLALLYAWFQKEAEHEALCQKLLKAARRSRFAATHDRAAKAYLAASVSNSEMIRLAEDSAKKAVELGEESVQLPWFQLIRGIAAYRAGDYEIAISWLNKAQADSRAKIRAPALLYRSLTHLRTGNTKDALADFEVAKRLVGSVPDRGSLTSPLPQNKLVVWMAFHEANEQLASYRD